MRKFNRILWGIVLIALGVVFALNALDIADIDVFFKGWWTLFLIIPSLIGLVTERDKTGNIVTLLIGVGLLLAARDIISFSMLWRLCIPVIIVIIGIRLILGAFFKKSEREPDPGSYTKGCKVHFVAFSGTDADYSGEAFDGCTLTAVFGGIDCYLQNAIIDHDVTITASAIFGGVDIILPQNVNVEVSSASFFGGVDNTRRGISIEGAPTVYVKASGVFGGVDIK